MENDYISFDILHHSLQFFSNMLTPVYVTTLLAVAIIDSERSEAGQRARRRTGIKA